MSTSKMDRTVAWVTLRHGTLGLIMLNRHWRSRYARGDESPMTLCGGVTMRERLSAWPERLAVALLAGVLAGALFWPLQCVTLVADVRRSPGGGGAERPSQTEDAVPRVSPDITPQPVHSTSCWGLLLPLASYSSTAASALAELQGEFTAILVGTATSLTTYVWLRAARKARESCRP
jgi:hypothetical protein